MSAYAFHPQAVADLDEIWEYIAAENIDAADRVIEDIHRAITMLASAPHIGYQRPELTSRPVRFHVVRKE